MRTYIYIYIYSYACVRTYNAVAGNRPTMPPSLVPLTAQLLAKSQEHRGGRRLIRVLGDHQRPRHGLDGLSREGVTRIQKTKAGNAIFKLFKMYLVQKKQGLCWFWGWG